MKYIAVLAAAMALGSVSVGASPQTGNLTHNPAQVQSGSYVLDSEHGKISWSISHMGFSTYMGQFTDVRATLNLDAANPSASRLVADIRTDSVGTFNAALDAHLKGADFLDTKKYPTARFVATSIRLTDARSAEITGNLTLRGVSRPVVMKAVFNQAGPSPADQKYTIGFDGHARIKRSDFGMTYALPLLGDEVTLHLEAEFKLQPKVAAKPGKGDK